MFCDLIYYVNEIRVVSESNRSENTDLLKKNLKSVSTRDEMLLMLSSEFRRFPLSRADMRDALHIACVAFGNIIASIASFFFTASKAKVSM